MKALFMGQIFRDVSTEQVCPHEGKEEGCGPGWGTHICDRILIVGLTTMRPLASHI